MLANWLVNWPVSSVADAEPKFGQTVSPTVVVAKLAVVAPFAAGLALLPAAAAMPASAIATMPFPAGAPPTPLASAPATLAPGSEASYPGETLHYHTIQIQAWPWADGIP